jgi:26S proteasome regulatory subunit N7
MEAKKLIDTGGDWDRRNRLKVYEALLFLILRDFKQAAILLYECIATFTCIELCSYEQFMNYVIVACVMCFDRTDLYKKLITNPQVISVTRNQPEIQSFLSSLYRCEYGEFFKALVDIHPIIYNDRYLGPHSFFIIKEYRILSYSQFLEAYRSVRMTSMAQSFGISLQLLDKELSRFIASGRVSAKIDKVGDIVETNRPDMKNAQYQETIKKGDALLNMIQRLIRVVDV